MAEDKQTAKAKKLKAKKEKKSAKKQEESNKSNVSSISEDITSISEKRDLPKSKQKPEVVKATKDKLNAKHDLNRDESKVLFNHSSFSHTHFHSLGVILFV